MGVNGLGRGEFERCLQGLAGPGGPAYTALKGFSTAYHPYALITHRARQRTPVVVVNNAASNRPSAFSRRIELKATGRLSVEGYNSLDYFSKKCHSERS